MSCRARLGMLPRDEQKIVFPLEVGVHTSLPGVGGLQGNITGKDSGNLHMGSNRVGPAGPGGGHDVLTHFHCGWNNMGG